MGRAVWTAALRGAGLVCLTACAPAQEPPRALATVPPAARPDAAAPSPAADPLVRSGRAPVVIGIVVDQLAAWLFEARRAILPTEPSATRGGFARLLREGTFVPEVRYAHAVTDTAPGHAALHTGAVPRESGVFGNEIIDERGDVVSVLLDERTRLIPGEGRGASAARLRVPTVADALRAAHRDAYVVSVSIKDRGAILPAGRSPSAAVWLDASSARFVTSTAFGAELPPFAARLGTAAEVRRRLALPWEVSPGIAAATPDDQAGEGDELSLGRTFPHVLTACTAPARAFRTSPASDAALLGMALAALDEAPSAALALPQLVLLSLSAHDYIGHVFGPDSWEARDELLRLDMALAAFFDQLDRRFGPNGWSVVLSADHGTTNMPEVVDLPGVRPWCATGVPDPFERACGPVVRIDLDELATRLRAAAEAAVPQGAKLVRGTADPYVFVAPEVAQLGAKERAAFDSAMRRVITATKGIERVFAVDELPAACPPLEGDAALSAAARVAALVCRSVAPRDGAHAGAYYMVTARGSFFDPRIVRGHGTSHGSPYLYDRTVPLFARAPGRIAAGRTASAPIDYRVFARTLSALVGVTAPPAAAAGVNLVGTAGAPPTPR